MATTTAVSMFRGDSHTVQVTVQSRNLTSGALTPQDLTGGVGKLTVKKKDSDTANLLQKTANPDSPATAGIISFNIDPSDTASMSPGVYTYDVQISLSGGRVYTVAKDRFELKADITTT